MTLLSFALDHLSQPIDAFGDTRAVNGVGLLNVPGTICDLTKVHLLGDLLLRVRIWQIRLICEKEHRQLSVPYVYRVRVSSHNSLSFLATYLRAEEASQVRFVQLRSANHLQHR